MIKTKADLLDYTEADRKANHMCEHYWLKLIYGNENARAFRYLKVLRKYEYAKNNHSFWRFWYRLVLRRLGLKYGISIFPNMVGKGLYISHLGGVIINCKSMGEWCTITSGVVVGNRGSQQNRPTIGNNVSLTLGCKVIGLIHIGDNVIVGPNSVVVKDVPANSVVSGIPARIIKQDGKKVE